MIIKDVKVGDVFLPKRAKVPQVVTHNYDLYVRTAPLESWRGCSYKASSSYGRSIYMNELNSDYKYDGNVNEEKGKNKMAKLFKVIGEELYGIHIGTNTAGEFVLEIRGDANNSIKAFKKDTLEEVKPYTVKLVALGSGVNPRHATVEKDKLSKSDVVIWNQTLWTVVELDTKQDNCAEINSKNCKRLVVGEL